MRSKILRNTGTDADGVAQYEADHFEKCPVCSQWFDIRDLAEVVEHIHDASEIEVAEGPSPEHERRPPTETALLVPGALAAVALKHTDGCFSLRVVDRPDQSQLVIARTALSE